jgi:hypothetical protein
MTGRPSQTLSRLSGDHASRGRDSHHWFGQGPAHQFYQVRLRSSALVGVFGQYLAGLGDRPAGVLDPVQAGRRSRQGVIGQPGPHLLLVGAHCRRGEQDRAQAFGRQRQALRDGPGSP